MSDPILLAGFVFVTYLIAGTIKGTLGVGLPTTALTIMTFFLSPFLGCEYLTKPHLSHFCTIEARHSRGGERVHRRCAHCGALRSTYRRARLEWLRAQAERLALVACFFVIEKSQQDYFRAGACYSGALLRVW